MQYSYFPVKLKDLSSRIHFTELEEGLFRIGDVLVETQYLNHTAPTIAYRISHGGSTVAYVTDHEPYWNDPDSRFQHPGDQRHVDFLKGADLIIHDAQYSEEEYRTKLGWGHSTIDYATDVAIAARARKLALFHHDPVHDDEMILSFEQHARLRAEAAGSSLQVFAAAEGMAMKLSEAGTDMPSARESALARRPIRGSRVLVVTENASDFADVEQALGEDAFVVSGVNDEQTAVERARQFHPDLVILVASLLEGNSADFIQRIRKALSKPDLPILVLTNEGDSHEPLAAAGLIATDYLVRPYSPPMLRSRVRSWLARTMGTEPESGGIAEGASHSLSVSADTGSDPSQILAAVELFRSLTPARLEKVLAGSSQRRFPAGYAILEAGERGNSVYVVLSGRVRVTESVAENLKDTYVTELKQGEVFGELGFLKERARSVSAVTLEPTACLLIPDADFIDALYSSPETTFGLIRIMARRLVEAERSLKRYANDSLTGLPGPRAFNELYKRISAGARRRGTGVLLIVADIVRLKTINDRYGYNVGDEVLRTVANVLVESSRDTDLVARYGSDEFAAVLVDADAEHAEKVIRRIKEGFCVALSKRGLPSEAELKTNFVARKTPPETLDDLLRDADSGIQ
jgi:diguanylate cyclase (GGDEF)-like protein